MILGVLASTLALGSCKSGDDDAGDAGEDPEAEVAWPTLSCDPLDPEYCIFPWPNNVYTVEDPDSPTGLRVSLDPTSLPMDRDGETMDVTRWQVADGFSPGASIMTQLPGASETGLAAADQIERSLEDDSPTVLLDAETGERVLHIAELDRSSDDADRQALLITPGVRLEPATRYIVAIRNVVDADGEPLPASPAFAALRDREPFDEDDSIEERRPLYTDIFQRLDKAGIPREDLQLAWDFTTTSVENLTSPMLKMRDEALADDIEYTIDEVVEDFDVDNIAYRIEGTMTVPTYLTDDDWPGVLQLDADGMPEQVGTTQVEFEVLIPHSATMEPAALLQYGHGLLGEKEQIDSSHFRSFINEYNYVLFAVDWIGMAAEDEPQIAYSLNEGWIDDIGIMMDRMHQGTLNQLLAMRMMSTSFADDPMFGSMIDPDQRYYHGISQGGILGGVYMALTTDVDRGALGVMGQPYNLLLLRSVDFELFFDIVRATWPDPRDVHMTLSLTQQLWDRVEPNGYTSHIRRDLLPGTPQHEVFMRAALGDHQVTTLGAHVMARSIDMPHLDTGLRQIPGLETVAGPVEGSAYVEYDFGLPPDPVCNVPQASCEDPHGKLRKLEVARQQLDHFLRNGEVQNFCAGDCVFADMSGCPGGDDNQALCEP